MLMSKFNDAQRLYGDTELRLADTGKMSDACGLMADLVWASSGCQHREYKRNAGLKDLTHWREIIYEVLYDMS